MQNNYESPGGVAGTSPALAPENKIISNNSQGACMIPKESNQGGIEKQQENGTSDSSSFQENDSAAVSSSKFALLSKSSQTNDSTKESTSRIKNGTDSPSIFGEGRDKPNNCTVVQETGTTSVRGSSDALLSSAEMNEKLGRLNSELESLQAKNQRTAGVVGSQLLLFKAVEAVELAKEALQAAKQASEAASAAVSAALREPEEVAAARKRSKPTQIDDEENIRDREATSPLLPP